jgi:hypothetical protein
MLRSNLKKMKKQVVSQLSQSGRQTCIFSKRKREEKKKRDKGLRKSYISSWLQTESIMRKFSTDIQEIFFKGPVHQFIFTIRTQKTMEKMQPMYFRVYFSCPITDYVIKIEGRKLNSRSSIELADRLLRELSELHLNVSIGVFYQKL